MRIYRPYGVHSAPWRENWAAFSSKRLPSTLRRSSEPGRWMNPHSTPWLVEIQKPHASLKQKTTSDEIVRWSLVLTCRGTKWGVKEWGLMCCPRACQRAARLHVEGLCNTCALRNRTQSTPMDISFVLLALFRFHNRQACPPPRPLIN